MATVQVRYIVRDVDAAIAFYTKQLGFKLEMHPAPPFAMLSRGDLRLALSAPSPAGGGGQPMPDGTQQEPGGGTDSQSKSVISLPSWRGCARQEPGFGTISSPVLAASRSSWRIPRATLLSSSNRSCLKPALMRTPEQTWVVLSLVTVWHRVPRCRANLKEVRRCDS